MAQSTAMDAVSATDRANAERSVDQAFATVRPQLVELVCLLYSGLTPAVFCNFEWELFKLLREFGRLLIEDVLNCHEGDGSLLPRDAIFDGERYRRLKDKTRNQHVATLFGKVVLWRFPYRIWDRDSSMSCIFPLELQLGLLEGISPALADLIGRRMGEAGASQGRVLKWLREQHAVAIGVERLRKFTAAQAERLAEHQEQAQQDALLQALQMADFSKGNRKPVIAVGRDGITLREFKHGYWQVATAGTVSVFDRAGKRLTTVYLAYRPELGQATMSNMLTSLLTNVLEEWHGPLPRLCYVADSGGNESSYFEDVLRKMTHPRTGKPLEWIRVVDFYHAAERVWALADALFGSKQGKRRKSWARRMLRLLKTKPNGAARILYSAAALRNRGKLSKAKLKAFNKAANYLRKRTKWMKYSEYSERHIPLGSGITEAACKSIFTQRLKLSGMRWTKEGATRILNLRTTLLSGVWEATYATLLATLEKRIPQPYGVKRKNANQIAA